MQTKDKKIHRRSPSRRIRKMSCWNKCYIKRAWNISNNTEADKRESIHALSLAKECYSMKLDLLTNATVVNDAIKFVIDSKQKLKLGNQKGIYNENNESKEEPDSDEKDSDRLQERNRNGKEQKKVKLRTRFFD
jgi:hypothetical protein